MPEHILLLINVPPSILLAQFLKAVKQITSRKLRDQRQKFWQERYFDRNVHGEEARSEVIRYIRRNPVKRGLVASSGDHPWSSFNHYATGVRGTVEIESEWTARLRRPLIAIVLFHDERAGVQGINLETWESLDADQLRCIPPLPL